MLTTLLAILTAIVLAWATGFGAYLWDTSDRIQSRLTIVAVALMIGLIYLAQQRQIPAAAPTATASAKPSITTGSLPD